MSTADGTAQPGRTFCAPEARVFVLVSAILASSMGFIDGAVLSIAIPSLRADLNASLTDAQWISNAYMLFLGALMLLGGALGDRYGLKRVFSLGIAVFVAASMVCAVSPDPVVLIIARAAQGAGAAMMVPGSLAIISAAYPREQRGRAIGIWASASALTTIMGPIIGGFVLTVLGDWSWRLVFAVNLPLGALALGLLYWKVPTDTPPSGRHLDIVGGLLATAALLGIALGLTGFGEESVPAVSHMLTWTGVGAALFVGFLIREGRAREPMMPLRLFANRAFAGANLVTLFLYFALSATLFFLPMVMISAWGTSPAIVSIALAPLGVAITLVSSVSGRLADRFGPAPLIAAGSILVAIGFGGVGLTAPLMEVWFVLLPLMAVFGVGMALVVSPLSTAVMTALDDSESGIASGVNNAVSRVAGLLAVAIMGGVASVTFQAGLGDLAGGTIGFGVAPETPLDPEAEAVRIAASNAALGAVCAGTAALSLLSAATAWLTLRHGPAAPA